MDKIQYKKLTDYEISREMFNGFIRRQVVTKCWRKEKGEWVIKDDPFIDDWDEKDYDILIGCLKNTVYKNGLVYAALCEGRIRGFVSVESAIFGGEYKYMDLTSIHVSENMRNRGIGSALFKKAKEWAKSRGAEHLYISAHSAVESQAFYKRMGCVEATIYCKKHVEEEPYDCQLECKL